MSARENILAKLKKADALPMEEPPVFDYYREMGVSWANDVERFETLGGCHACRQNGKSIGLLNLTGRKYSAKQPKAKA